MANNDQDAVVYMGIPLSSLTEKAVPDATDKFLIETAEGPRVSKWENVLEKITSGINLGFITPSSPSAPATGIHRGQAAEAGTYTNFGGIAVTSAELLANFVYIEVTNGVAKKVLSEKPGVDLTNELKTHSKLKFNSQGKFIWDNTTKVLSWTNQLWVLKHSKTGTNPTAIIITSGSIDFKAFELANTSSSFCTAHIVSSGFLAGTTQLETLEPSSIILSGHKTANFNDVKALDVIVLFHYNKFTGQVSSPFFDEFVQTGYLNTISSSSFTISQNKYPNIPNRIRKAFGKYMGIAGMTAENRFRVITYGDSIFARTEHTTALGIVTDSNPPTLTTKTIPAYIWDSLRGNKPLYSRYDKVGSFTESGIFSTVLNDTAWDDNGDIDNTTRVSTAANSAFDFTVGSTNNYFNLIDRTSSKGALAVTVSVSGGNGVLMVKLDDGVSPWVEANGFVFSQRKTISGTGDGNTVFQRRILFKKVNLGVGTAQTVTVTKDATTSDLYYWGIEVVPNNNGYIQLINVARGSHTLNTGGSQLANYVLSDVRDRRPDLVVLELPLINMAAASATNSPTLIKNALQDFILGDRVGFLNANSLKNLSNNFVDFDVLFIIPHQTKAHYAADFSYTTIAASGYTYADLYSAAKSFLYENNLPFVDISTIFERKILNDPNFIETPYTAYSAEVLNANSYVKDSGTHPNNKGVKVYADEICDIFLGNTN